MVLRASPGCAPIPAAVPCCMPQLEQGTYKTGQDVPHCKSIHIRTFTVSTVLLCIHTYVCRYVRTCVCSYIPLLEALTHTSYGISRLKVLWMVPKFNSQNYNSQPLSSASHKVTA